MLGQNSEMMADGVTGAKSPLDFAVAARDRETVEMVRNAIRQRQVMLAFQPVVQARDTGKIAFHEGLIRVLDDHDRVIPAGAFMDMVEDTEIGRELDTLALAKGLRVLDDHPDLRLSINMSVRSIGYEPWERTLAWWLKKNSFLAERLIIEITESSAMMAPDHVIDFMDRLHFQGICFAMDDFGAGQTAMRYFKDFCFDIVKIDGQFIRGIAQSPDNQVLTSALLSIARHFDMLTVAEYVETQEDADMLIGLGVDCLQGYHFGAATTRPDWAVTSRAHQAV